MGFGQVDFKLKPPPPLPVIERILAPANQSVCPGLKIKVRFCSHRLDEIDNRWKAGPGCPCLFASKGTHFQVFRPNSEDHIFPDEFAGGRSIGCWKSDLNCSVSNFAETHLVAILLELSGNEIHWRATEKAGDEEVRWLVIEDERRI